MKRINLSFRKIGPGKFRASLARAVRRPVLVEVGLSLPPGYLEKHCRFARLIKEAKPPTFLNTMFAEQPPGTRVGPWPGWRGIPELPVLQLETMARTMTGKYYFLGDEEAEGELRVMFGCEEGLSGTVTLNIPDPELRPVRAQGLKNLPTLAPALAVSLRPKLREVHPRLVVDAKQVVELRNNIRNSRISHWRRLQKLVKDSWGLPFRTTPEGKVLPGPERLSGADRTLIAACMALLRPTKINTAWALRTFFAYLRETKRADFEPLGIDTQSGEVLYLLCVAYDWLHEFMSPAQRVRAQGQLFEIAAICRRHLDPERRDYAQAHYLGCGMGLLAFSFLFWEEHPEAKAWAAELRGAFGRVLAMLPTDGFFPHGLNLWIYEHGFLLRWLELLRQGTGEDLWKDAPYFAAASRFRAAATAPDRRYGITFGDPQYRVSGDSWCHLLIAQRTGEASAQAIGETLLNQRPEGTDHRHAPPRRRVYELLWHKVKLKPRALGEGVERFADGGQVFVRRGKTLVTLRSGSPLGRHRRTAGEVGGYGHTDPCNGAVLVWRGGTFVGSGPGPLYRRDTALHNLVTIGGRGQVGDSCVWYPDFLEAGFIPPEPVVRQRGSDTHIRCELTSAYLPHLGVLRHTRKVVVSGEGSLRGEDVIELGNPEAITWHWHTRAQVLIKASSFFLRGPSCRALLSIEPEIGTQVRIQPETFVAAYPHEGTVGTVISVSRFAAQTTFRWQLT